MIYISSWCAKKEGQRESTEKKERERNAGTNFVVCASILIRNDLTAGPRGVLTAAARHKALLIAPWGPLRAMVVGANSPGLHFRLPLT